MSPGPVTIPQTASALQQSGLDATEFSGHHLSVKEIPGIAAVHVQRLPGTGGPGAGVRRPTGAGECRRGDPAVLCLGPREWLFLSEKLAPDELVAQAREQSEPGPEAACNLTDGLAVIRVDGFAAPWLLAKTGSLDFPAWPGGGPRCARTRLGRITAVVHFSGEALPHFDLIVDRSLARYLWELLLSRAPHAGQLCCKEETA